MLDLLFQDPATFLIRILALIYGITVHEFGHALAGYWQGDMTAKDAGRLSLNPLRHLDPIGTIMIVLTGFFGWGKPTPYNPYNLRNRRYGALFVGLLGPALNFISLIIFGLVLRLLVHGNFLVDTALFDFIVTLTVVNLVLMVFNLIPVPPLDGSKFLDLLPAAFDQFKAWLFRFGPTALIIFILIDNLSGYGLLGQLFSKLVNLTLQVFL